MPVALVGQHLFEQRERVAIGAVGGAGDQGDGGGFGPDAFGLRDLRQARGDLGDGAALELEDLAAGSDGDRQFVQFGRGENEDDAVRRLFQRLQEGVHGVARKLVGFVDDVDLVAAFHRRELDAGDQIAHVVHFAVRGGVHFEHVHEVRGGDDFGTGRRRRRVPGWGRCRVPSGPMQLRALARMRAQVVLAVPRVPVNR